MIGLILDDCCTGCGACVAACPTHVLDQGAAEAAPVIARLDDFQTCHLCEPHRPEDAFYVAPDQHATEDVDPEWVRASGRLGRMKGDQGWANGADAAPLEHDWRLGPLLGEGAEIAARRYARAHPEWTPPGLASPRPPTQGA